MDRRRFIQSGSAAAALGALPLSSRAQARPKDVLVVGNEFGPNSLDIHTVGANRASYGVSWICYDRLMSYGRKTLPDGRVVFASTRFPVLSQQGPVASNLFVTNVDGTGLTRITTERQGGEEPSVDPTDGRLLYAPP